MHVNFYKGQLANLTATFQYGLLRILSHMKSADDRASIFRFFSASASLVVFKSAYEDVSIVIIFTLIICYVIIFQSNITYVNLLIKIDFAIDFFVTTGSIYFLILNIIFQPLYSVNYIFHVINPSNAKNNMIF